MDWFTQSGTDLFIRVRVTPNAARNAVAGLVMRADNRQFLAIRTSALAENGKANSAVIAIVAKALGVTKTSIAIATGSQSREKTLLISSPSESAIAKLAQLHEQQAASQ
ncbi:DUF167 domain-containing protein [Pelagibacterium lentulum]|uniref:UPF0235 protein GCM10011499_03130 n=1 Tax=Pelagibacterium lentulum TaxID=2029865 RepID=A0A916R686_9HYPH|nr:DUF167 family protein [Pelagibacterium lentulum]GGA37142.1 hypothetical protein GCM10011499_03130 [Pelagibacterium lentulum]